jgi:hypothetical protein
MAARKTTAPVDGHKCLGMLVTYLISFGCECGWSSPTHSGVGAQKLAKGEWRKHADSHVKKEAK